jgi:hypothetical protein
MSNEREHLASAIIVSLHDYYPGGCEDVEPRKRRRSSAAAVRRPRALERTPKVTHDWTAGMPVTEAELDVFEAHFGPFLDELLGPQD